MSLLNTQETQRLNSVTVDRDVAESIIVYCIENRKTYVLVYRLHKVGLTAKEMFENFALWYKVDVE